ncbi:hypothetical protein [Hymenobacter sp. YC55]|uniref:hypothetical protein n=1 Tax=Hymenobacter sp. YC55 TaxID=3034019 RepID=UPI0023F9C0F8|nr:hypothetical protein [Hymenobacter sp. YC55]MDF7811238.1 hypothetical protein [Hymenobacter sp. YC55]
MSIAYGLFFVFSSIWVFLGATEQAKEYWLAQLAFFIMLTFIALWMKLPLRLAVPLFSIWAVGILIYLVRCNPSIPSLTLSWQWALCIIVVVYTTKLWRQGRAYHHHQVENEAYISQVYAVAKHRTLVVGGVEQAYQYLSPFATYELSDSPVLTLMGWLTLEPSLASLRQHMTGTRDFEDSLLRLAAKPNTLWIMHESFASYLQLYTKRHRPASTAALSLVEKQRLSSNPKFAKVYQGNVTNQ